MNGFYTLFFVCVFEGKDKYRWITCISAVNGGFITYLPLPLVMIGIDKVYVVVMA